MVLRIISNQANVSQFQPQQAVQKRTIQTFEKNNHTSIPFFHGCADHSRKICVIVALEHATCINSVSIKKSSSIGQAFIITHLGNDDFLMKTEITFDLFICDWWHQSSIDRQNLMKITFRPLNRALRIWQWYRICEV